jgi:c(7)-type cytochrome triheme protein
MRTPVILVVVFVAAGALAASWPNLPPDFTFPRHADSPGPVVFKHATHMEPGRPDCTVCHPHPWKITQPPPPVQATALSHERFDNGEKCGGCHDGKRGFKMSKCDSCHDMFADEDDDEEEGD